MIDEKKLIFLNNYYINNSSEQSIFEILQHLYGQELSNIDKHKDLILKLIPLYRIDRHQFWKLKKKLF